MTTLADDPSRSGAGRPPKARAVAALGARLREALPPDRREAMPTPSHTAAFEDNLLPTITAEQAAAARAFLEQGDGRELESRPDGSPPNAHAAHSSATAAVNVFAAWIGRSEPLTLPGLPADLGEVQLEAKVPFQRGGTPPNLDALLVGTGVRVGVESKLTEYLDAHGPRQWQESIGRPENLELLDGGWRRRLEDAMSGAEAPRHLEEGQLLRHALGMQRRHADATTYLVYLYWEPTDGGDEPVVDQHRQEVRRFADQVGTGAPTFVALTHAALVDHWDQADAPSWLREHCAAWRQRYQVPLG